MAIEEILSGESRNVEFKECLPEKSIKLKEGTGKLPENCRETADKLSVSEQEQQIRKFVLENGAVMSAQAAKLLGISQRRVREILGKMTEKKWLRKEGTSRSTVYVLDTD